MYLRSTIVNRVAEVMLDHPPVNALDSAGWEHLAATIAKLGADPDVSVVLIGAEGRGFCAGVDIKELARDRSLITEVNRGCYDAFAAIRPGGKVILAGIPEDDRTSFSASIARRKGLTIKMVRRMKHTYPRAIELVVNGLVNVRSLVTHRFPMGRVIEAFQVAARREGLKVLIEI